MKLEQIEELYIDICKVGPQGPIGPQGPSYDDSEIRMILETKASIDYVDDAIASAITTTLGGEY